MSIAPEYIAARGVLLDALSVLQGHLDSLILVGAQAIYHHTGDADLHVPLLTTDADLAVNTRELTAAPEIGGLMRTAGFTPGPNPGHWVNAADIAVDLMVVPHQSGTTRATARAARLAPHEKLTARIAPGLEAALIDNAPVKIGALESGDSRAFELRIAGPAALLTAKAIKVGERLGQAAHHPDWLREKDALDAFRLFQVIDTADLAAGFASHQADEHARRVSAQAIEIYRTHAATPDGRIAQLAAAAARDAPIIAPSFAILVDRLLAALPASDA